MTIHEKVSKNDSYNCNIPHIIWHKFDKWLYKNFGKNYTLKLHGFDVILKISKYLKKYIPEIKILPCNDSEYASSIILLIPHPKHGITIMFIPQSTELQNQFFLYSSHFDLLVKELSDMKKVYENEY